MAISKIQHIIEDRLGKCTRCNEPENEKLRNHYDIPRYYVNIKGCAVGEESLNSEKWRNIFKRLLRKIESEPEKRYRNLRTIVDYLMDVKALSLEHEDMCDDYRYGDLKNKYTEVYRKKIEKLEEQIREIQSIPDRDILIHVCKKHNIYKYGKPSEAEAELYKISKEQLGVDLKKMLAECVDE